MKKYRRFVPVVLAGLLFFMGSKLDGGWPWTAWQGDADPVLPHAVIEDTDPNGLTLEAAGAILVELSSGEVLFAYNAMHRVYPASITKLLTALVALECGDPEEIITVGEELRKVAAGSSLAGLQPGDRLTLGALIWAMLLPSGNDAALVTAVYTARKEAGDPSMDIDRALKHFTGMMNRYARSLGVKTSGPGGRRLLRLTSRAACSRR